MRVYATPPVGIGADPVPVGARFSGDYRTLPGMQAAAPQRRERSHRRGAVAILPEVLSPNATYRSQPHLAGAAHPRVGRFPTK